jgi:K+-sensing histidine kinase KdpD
LLTAECSFPALDFSHSSPEFCHSIFGDDLWRRTMLSIQKTQSSARIPILRRMDSLLGSVVCAILALLVSALAAGHSWQVWVPLGFTVVLLLTAWFFGLRAGILGTLLAAAVFAGFLFVPLGSLRVASEPARANLGWMMLIGIAFSLLFAPSASGFRRPERSSETTEPDSRAS